MKHALYAAKRLFDSYFKQVALVATVIGVAVALIGQRHAITSFDWRLDPAAMALAVALFAVAPIVQGLCFWLVLRSLGVPSRLDEALVIWSRSFLLRYAPSGALALVIRIKTQDRLGASSGDIYASFGYEQLVALISGAAACVGGFLLAHGSPPRISVAVLVASLAAGVAARPAFLGRWTQSRLRDRGIEVPSLMRGRWIAAVSTVNLLGWVATGAGAWVMVDALTTSDRPGFWWLLGAYAFAWLLGFIVPLLPGGLGLRDATLVAFLAGGLGAGAATAVALALRLANTMGEFVAIGLVELVYLAIVRSRPARRRFSLGSRPAEAAVIVVDE